MVLRARVGQLICGRRRYWAFCLSFSTTFFSFFFLSFHFALGIRFFMVLITNVIAWIDCRIVRKPAVQTFA